MYYRKYFEGEIDDVSITTSIKLGIDTNNTTIYVNQTKILGNAIASILKSIGFNSEYNENTFILHFDKNFEHGIYIFFTAQNSYTIIPYSSESISSPRINSSTSYPIFYIQSGSKKGTYKFYITFKGDPKSLILTDIGYYSKPSGGGYYFIFGYGLDIRYNKKVFLFNAGAALGSARSTRYHVRNIDSTLVEGYKTSTTIQVDFRIVRLASSITDILPLINIFSYDGYFVLENCFSRPPQISSLDAFYLIDGDEYYILDDYTIIKCTTKLPQTLHK